MPVETQVWWLFAVSDSRLSAAPSTVGSIDGARGEDDGKAALLGHQKSLVSTIGAAITGCQHQNEYKLNWRKTPCYVPLTHAALLLYRH